MNNLYLVSGSQDLLRNRLVAKMIQEAEGEGFTIDYVDASHPGALEGAFQGSPFVGGRTFVVVTNPHKGDLDVYDAQLKAKNPSVVALLDHEGDPKGNTKFGKWSKTLKDHANFSEPTEWAALEVAADFLIMEAEKIHKKKLSRAHANAIVRLSGTNLGVLVFEVQKMAILATVDGSESIEVEHVRGGLADLVAASADPLLEALRARNKVNLIKAMNRMYERSPSDPTMYVCRLIGAEAIKWLSAVSFIALPPKVAAEHLGLNPWYYENKILPVARYWGRPNTIRLIKAVAASERGLLRGNISPWNGLLCNLLQACSVQ